MVAEPKKTLIAIAVLAISCSAPVEQEAPPSYTGKRPNVLLICIDDLRPELGCYGADHVQSPNLDKFAASGLRFDRQYATFPTGGASRYSFLTGQEPSLPSHYGNGAFDSLQQASAPGTSLPASFRSAGYQTICIGKVSQSNDGKTRYGRPELPDAWDELQTDQGPWSSPHHLLRGYANGASFDLGRGPISEAADVDDSAYPDGMIADQVIKRMERLVDQSQPFFLAVGFYKPHLPFAAPKKYWDLYDPNTLPRCEQTSIPEDLPPMNGLSQSGEVTNNYTGSGYRNGSWPTAELAKLRHGYFACVSYVDAQVGRVLDSLETLGLASDTIVVVWGDHGIHLGELGVFGKHTVYEASLRSALLMRVPGVTHAGTSTRALIQSLDVYPTLAELCHVPLLTDVAGLSFSSVLAYPTAKHRSAAISHWRRGNWIGTSLRTSRYRLIGWTDPISSREGGVELYDLEPPGTPPGQVIESENISLRSHALIKSLVRKHL
ncbi:MAG: arylsulfatase A-like enzyme [Planctomycetota bacterium]|jgi:arylsulfatase A-like enzyme